MKFQSCFDLRYYQSESVDATMEAVRKDGPHKFVIALPTGSGKSLVIAEIAKRCIAEFGYKILIVSHVKEILEQNVATIEAHTGITPAVYSSMMNRKEIGQLTVAGIQSIYRSAYKFFNFDIIIVDEAHRIAPGEDTMYQRLFQKTEAKFTIGLTATPFRLGDGSLYGKNKEFECAVVDYTSREAFAKLVKEKYMSPLTAKRTSLEMDVSKIKMVAGDFSEKDLSSEFDRVPVSEAAVREIIAAGAQRKSWIIFAIDIAHSEHITEVLLRNGIPSAPVHSKMQDYGLDRDTILGKFKRGELRCIVNVNVLTTGFDHPGIDLIGMLRPTTSPVLHVQCLGRGSRVTEGKENCLVLDFAGNTSRLGPINEIVVKEKGKGMKGGDPITKVCPSCNSILSPAVKLCPDCGHKFQFLHGLTAESYTETVFDDGKPHWLIPSKVTYSMNDNHCSPNSVKVMYHIGNKKISEWVCIEHKGFAKHKADHWVKWRGGEPCNSAAELLDISPSLRIPRKILVSRKGRYHTITDSVF